MDTAKVSTKPFDKSRSEGTVPPTYRGGIVPASGIRSLLNVIRNIGWSFANEVCRAASFAFVVILLARHLGPTEYGMFVFGLSVVKIAWVIAMLGLDRVLIRELVLRPQSTRHTIGKALVLKVIAAGVSYMLLQGVSAVALPRESTMRSVICLCGLLLLFQPFDAFDNLFQARERLKLTFFGKTIPMLFGAGLKCVGMIMGSGVLVFASLEALTAALIAIGLVAVYWFALRESVVLQNEKPKSISSLLRDSLPLFVSAIAVIIYMRSDLIMIGLILGKQQTGIYAAAAQVSELWNIVPVAIAPAVLPLLLRYRQSDVKNYERRLALLLQIVAAAGIVIALTVSVLASSIISALYGDAYAAATPILRLHVWSLLFVFLGVLQNLWDMGEKFYWTTCVRTTLGAAVNIVLNLMLIPKYGGLGAAFATVLSYAMSGLLLNGLLPKTRGLFIMQLEALSLVPLIRTLATSIRSNVR